MSNPSPRKGKPLRPQTAAGFRSSVEELAARDRHLAQAVQAYGPPDFWHRQPGFATLVLFILEQQVSLASGAAAFNKLRARVGEITPESVLIPDDEELRADGFSRQKARYVRQLAKSVIEDGFDLDALGSLDDSDAKEKLTGQLGIGPWTADVYLLSCLRRPDVWPVLDRALQVAVSEVIGLGRVPAPAELMEIGERWRPHRSSAARLMWHSYLARRGRKETAF